MMKRKDFRKKEKRAMKTNKLRELFRKNLPTVSTRLWSTDPFFYEAAGQTGFVPRITSWQP